jgi:hypothetical protein
MNVPRERIRPENGFSVLPQAGLRVAWGDVIIEFKGLPCGRRRP